MINETVFNSDLASDDTIVVLGGTSRYDKSLDVCDLPQVEANIKKLFLLLTDQTILGLPSQNLYFLLDCSISYFITRLQEAVRRESKRFLFYYCGHGKCGRTLDSLILPLINSTSSDYEFTGIEFAKIASILKTTPAQNKYVILDTCYSERAFKHLLGSEDDLAQVIVNQVENMTAMAAASKVTEAKNQHPELLEHTLFTGEIIHLLSSGFANDCSFITADELFKSVQKKLLSLGGPAPKISSGDGKVPFVINRGQVKSIQQEKEPSFDITPHTDYLKRNAAVDRALANAHDEIWFFGINFRRSTKERFHILEDRLASGVSLKCIVFDHTSSFLAKVAKDLDREASTLKNEAMESFKDINILIKTILESQKSFNPAKNIQIKLTQKIPKVLVYIIDPNRAEGTTIFIPYMSGIVNNQRAGFEVKNIGQGIWYNFYKGIIKEWNKATPLSEKTDCGEWTNLDYKLEE